MENNDNNNLMSMLLPMLMNRSGDNNNMLYSLMPALLARNGGNRSDMMNMLAPMMEKQNPDMARILKSLNGGGNFEHTPEVTVSDTTSGYSKTKNKYIDYNKLYPQNAAKLTDGIENLTKINNQKFATNNYDSFNTAKEPENNQNNNFNTMLSILQMMQALRSNNNAESASTPEKRSMDDALGAIEKFAPPKIKKSLRAILELNSIIRE